MKDVAAYIIRHSRKPKKRTAALRAFELGYRAGDKVTFDDEWVTDDERYLPMDATIADFRVDPRRSELEAWVNFDHEEVNEGYGEGRWWRLTDLPKPKRRKRL